MLTQLINARILTPQGWLKDGSVLIRDGKILEVTNCDLAVIGAQLIDVKGMYVLPGGVEIHAHGGGGRDFMECTEDAFRGAVQTHMKYGTASIFPTLSSSTVPMIEQAAETCTKMMAEKDSPILGLHLEGHYLNMAMAGGQMPENIKNPDPNEYIPIVESGHCIIEMCSMCVSGFIGCTYVLKFGLCMGYRSQNAFSGDIFSELHGSG